MRHSECSKTNFGNIGLKRHVYPESTVDMIMNYEKQDYTGWFLENADNIIIIGRLLWQYITSILYIRHCQIMYREEQAYLKSGE